MISCWLTIAGAGLATLHAAEEHAAPRRETDPVVVRGKAFEIRQSQLDERAIELRVSAGTRGETPTAAQQRRLETQALDQLILANVLPRRASAEDQAKAQERANEIVAERKRQAGSEDAYRRQLLASGSRPEIFEKRALELALVDRVIENEVKSKVTVTDEQVRAFYDHGTDLLSREVQALAERLAVTNKDSVFYRDATNRLGQLLTSNRARLDRPEQARARILVLFTIDPTTQRPLSEDARRSKRERITQLRQRIKTGEDLAQLAAEYSEEPEADRNKGEYVARANRVVLPELKEALFSSSLGTISDVLTTSIGYYIVQVLERTPGGRPTFEQAEKDIREYLLRQAVEMRLPDWLDQVKKENDVVIVGAAAP